VEESPLLALELSAIDGRLLAASLNTDLDLSFIILSTDYFLFFLITLVSEVLKLLLCLLSLGIVAINFIFLILIVFILSKLLQ
jgi:hypothetical protein